MGFLSGPWGVHQARPREAEVLAKASGALVLGALSSHCLLPPHVTLLATTSSGFTDCSAPAASPVPPPQGPIISPRKAHILGPWGPMLCFMALALLSASHKCRCGAFPPLFFSPSAPPLPAR